MTYIWTGLIFAAAAATEIGGSYAFWAWLKLEKSALLIVPGLISLGIFAILLSRVDSAFAGRTFAAYGGVYIVASLVWLVVVRELGYRNLELKVRGRGLELKNL